MPPGERRYPDYGGCPTRMAVRVVHQLKFSVLQNNRKVSGYQNSVRMGVTPESSHYRLLTITSQIPWSKNSRMYALNRADGQGTTVGCEKHPPEIPSTKSIVDYIFRWLGVKFLGRNTAQRMERNTGDNLLPRGTPDRTCCLARCCGCATLHRVRAPMMSRNGSCYKCGNCGGTSGCS
jgi:hypothetical protein